MTSPRASDLTQKTIEKSEQPEVKITINEPVSTPQESKNQSNSITCELVCSFMLFASTACAGYGAYLAVQDYQKEQNALTPDQRQAESHNPDSGSLGLVSVAVIGGIVLACCAIALCAHAIGKKRSHNHRLFRNESSQPDSKDEHPTAGNISPKR